MTVRALLDLATRVGPVLVDLALAHGLDELLASWVGSGTGTLDLMRVSAVGAGPANVVDNLPAYLALESVTDDGPRRLLPS